jgi:hypothetical protein
MQARLQLLHSWQRQLHTLLPGVRITQVRGLGTLVVGILLARTVRLPAVAATLPGAAGDESRIRRLRRWLANPRVEVATLWPPLRRALLRDLAGRELLLVFDPTPHTARHTLLVLGLVQHKRVLPLAWRIVPQQTPWDDTLAQYLAALVAEIAADLPAGCTVTVLADRGVTGPATLQAVRTVGWHVVFRLNAGPHQTHRVRVDGQEHDLWRWLTTHTFAWAGPVELFKGAGWQPVELTVHRDRGQASPWVLVSDEPAGPARVRAYRRRTRIEATFEDAKSRGFDLERTKVQLPDRLDRLLFALVLALWWGTQLGLRLIRAGQRPRYDRRERRDRSVLTLGDRHLHTRLLQDRCPPLPFFQRDGTWHYALYA